LKNLRTEKEKRKMAGTIHSGIIKKEVQGKWEGLLVSSYVQYAGLAAITLLALLLRLYKLGEWGFWIDEVLTVNRVVAGLDGVTRPSFYMIGIALNLFGVSDWSARLAPALVGVFSLPIFYFPIRRLFGPTVALLAILLLAISPWHLYWSQNARFYMNLILFYTLGALAFYWWLETDRPIYLVAAIPLMGLAALERMNTAFFGPVLVAYALALLVLPFGRPLGFRWRNLFLLAVPLLLFAAYQIIVVGILDSLNIWIFGRNHSPIRVLLSVIYDIGLPLFLFALLGGIYLVLQKSRVGLFFFLGAVVPLLTLMVMSPFTQAFSRYLFMTLPFWAVLAAVAAKEIFQQAQKPGRLLALGVILVLLADAFSQNFLYFNFQNGNRENFKDAYALVQERMQPEDWVVTTRPEIAGYYMGIQAVDSNRIDLDGIISSGRPAWFVMDNRTYISNELQTWLSTHTRIEGVFDVYIPGRPMEMRVYFYNDK
jgi:mannosyltransferase